MSAASNRYNLRKRTPPAHASKREREPPATHTHQPNGNGVAAGGSTTPEKNDALLGTNWVHGGGIEANPYLFVLIVVSPFLSLLLSYITSVEMQQEDISWSVTHPLTEMVPACLSSIPTCVTSTLSAGASVLPTYDGAKLVLSFMAVALVLERILPGKIDFGPETATGHVPRYVDNGVAHCFVYSLLFFLGSNLGPCGEVEEERLLPAAIGNFFDMTGVCGVYRPYSFGVLYDLFPSSLAFLNIFGILFCVFLMLKGIHFPSTQDNGSSGTWVKDYLWGTELYPRVFGLDIKRFINCRFSMTYWQLAGFSFCYHSYVLHGNVMDWGLFFSALSQYLYLVKFFFWVSDIFDKCIIFVFALMVCQLY